MAAANTHRFKFNRLIAFSQTVDPRDVLHRFLDGEPGHVVGALSDQRTRVFRVSRGHYARGPGNCPAKRRQWHSNYPSPKGFNGGPGNCPAKP